MFILIWIAATLLTGPIGFVLWPVIYYLGNFAPKPTSPKEDHPFGDIPYEDLP